MSDTCPHCGRKLNGIMSTDPEQDIWEMISSSPGLLAIVGVLIVLMVVCGEAVLR